MTRSGEPIPVILSASVMRLPDDLSATGIVLVAQDISELQQNEREPASCQPGHANPYRQ